MFTVIFAEKETIKLFEETKMFFGPLYRSEQIAFCQWNKDGETLEAMAPGIYDIIEYHEEWRALVLYSDGFEKLNPFDYTEYCEPYYAKGDGSWNYLKDRREKRIAAYEKAVSNPLVKLTTALCGLPGFKSAVSGDAYSKLMAGEMQTYEYMLQKQLQALNCTEMAVRFDKYQRDDLKRFVAEPDITRLIGCIKEADVSGITKLIPDTEILDFIRFIGNDPIYFDPEYTECLIENTKANELLKTVAGNFSMKDKMPYEVICVSPRTFDFENVEQDIKWKKKDEASSSKFADFNLYPDKLKFLLFDILPQDNKQYKFDQIKFMCLLLVLANNQTPQGVIGANYVYRAKIDFNLDMVTQICEHYISKLKSTQMLLKDIEVQLDCDSETSVDNRTAQRLFESDINIPVKLGSDTNESELYAEYKSIGLSTDCPTYEDVYWAQQYRKINKSFLRYLREPRRAVKNAASEGLRKSNFIYDDRTLLLTENQLEDVKFHMAELEQKMVETTTTHLFDTKKYTEQIEEADKEVKQGIAQRMTKKKTLFVGLTALLAYFIGFLPLIFTNLNTTKAFLFSLIVTGIPLGILLVVGFIYLFFLRRKLVKKIRHFNFVMSSICGQINSALAHFSGYISCICNLMRDSSVLKKRDSAVERTKKVLSYHNIKITERIKKVHEMFAKYVDFEKIFVKPVNPYEYDFTVLRDYDYEMPSILSSKKIQYMQPGNEITLPVDYVEAIMITREELYD